MYEIFDLSLPDEYIQELTGYEISTLIEEAQMEILGLEKEIDSLMWPDSTRISDDPNHPMPSEFSYDPMLYREEIEADPEIEEKLQLAKELSERVGLAMAVLGSAQLQRAKIINLEAKIEREKGLI